MSRQAATIAEIDALLPQTHCGKCGYSGCQPYAEALSNGSADINQCPPGGETTLQALAELLDKPVKPIDQARGIASPPQVAVIDENACIGCVKCLRVCPVDAIIGAAKQMHSIITADCTGCELCLPPCPVDCIDLIPAAPMSAAAKARARTHYQRRQTRLQRQTIAARQKQSGDEATDTSRADKQDFIAAAVARSRARRKLRTT
ncbi:MAG: RnfABCDGE type electron transport complex subunit B [Gammaproteobacteria bacterium]